MSIVDDASTLTTAASPTEPEDAPALMGGISPTMKIVMVAVMPIFLVITFILCFVSAGHAPTPYQLPLVISGSEQVTAQISEKLIDATDEDAFNITMTTSASVAQDAVLTREAAGAVVITDSNVTTYYATGAGAFQASIIKSVGAQIAGEMNVPSTPIDVAPTPAEDPAGTLLFFFMVVCTLGAFLSIVTLTMTNPKGGLKGQLATVVGSSILGPVIGFFVISSYTGGFGMAFATIAAVIGVGMLYSAVIGVLTVVLARIAGLGGILIGMILLITLNFPSSGGSNAEGMLPPFWQFIHNTWMGSAMVEWIRGIVYFDGAQTDRWAAQLLMWGAVAAIALVLIVVIQTHGSALMTRFRAIRARSASNSSRRMSAATQQQPAAPAVATKEVEH